MRLSDLPYEQFKMLGVKKNDLVNLPPRTLNALLNGQRTSLIRFNNVEFAGLDTPISLDAKLSIEKKADGQPTLKIYPVNKTAKNTFNLSAEEIASLENGDALFIERQIRLADNSLKGLIVYLDKITNEFVAINKASITAPDEINGIRLTETEKEDFKNGRTITINGNTFQLNPTSEIGLTSTDGNDLKIDTVRFKQSSYSKKELAIDLALLVSGLENMVLLEHLANIALYTAPQHLKNQNTLSNIGNPQYWEALNEASKEIKSLTEDDKYNTLLIAAIVNKHLERIGIVYHIDAETSATEVRANEQTIVNSNPVNTNVKTKRGRKAKV